MKERILRSPLGGKIIQPKAPSFIEKAVKLFPAWGNNKNWVVISKIFGIFIPIPGEMIQFDEHIFQMG